MMDMDKPYKINTCGRIVVGKTKDSGGLQRTIVAGLMIGDLINGECLDFELWDVEVEITVRRKHTGSPLHGGTINQQLTNALNRPEDWEEKTFDTLMPERRAKPNDKPPKRSSKKSV